MALTIEHIEKISVLLQSNDLSVVKQGTTLAETLIESEKEFHLLLEKITGAVFIESHDFAHMIGDIQEQIYTVTGQNIKPEQTHNTILKLLRKESAHPIIIGKTPSIIKYLFHYDKTGLRYSNFLGMWAFGVFAQWNPLLAEMKELKFECNDPIPDSLVNLKKLRKLHIECFVYSIGDAIGTLSNLTSLTLTAELGVLPEAIGNLTNLTHLDLNSNYLESLPSTIGNLTNLTSLNLSDNTLDKLPDCIENLTNLQHLDLRWIGLSSLPDWIVNLTNLKKVELSGNSIDSQELERVKALLPHCEIVFD